VEPIVPQVTIVTTPSFAVLPGQRVTVQVIATGVADITQVALSVDGRAVTLDAQGRLNFTPAAPGRYELLATALDAQGAVGSAAAVIKVRDPADARAPITTLLLPLPGAVLTAPTQVRASVADINLDFFRLDLVDLATGSVRVLATGNASFDQQAIAALDPGALRNGAYVVRLVAQDIAGRISITERLVEIDTATKSGAYTETATDLVTHLNGMPISIKRFYDSLGAGVSGVLGAAGHLVEPNRMQPYPCCRRAAKLKVVFKPLTAGASVYLETPNGERVRFAFAPVEISLGRGLCSLHRLAVGGRIQPPDECWSDAAHRECFL
jgi:hypothetical protein